MTKLLLLPSLPSAKLLLSHLVPVGRDPPQAGLRPAPVTRDAQSVPFSPGLPGGWLGTDMGLPAQPCR